MTGRTSVDLVPGRTPGSTRTSSEAGRTKREVLKAFPTRSLPQTGEGGFYGDVTAELIPRRMSWT